MNAMPIIFHQKSLAFSCMILGLILSSGCATKKAPPVLRASDAEMGRLAQQAQSLFEMQRPAQAAPLYQSALDRARALNDDVTIARLAYNLGACRFESGDARGACAAFEEAIHAARAAGLPEEDAQLLLGYALLHRGEIDRTLILCSEALKAMALQAESEMRVRFLLLRAEVYLLADRIESAEETLQEVIHQWTPKPAPAIQARAAHIEGTILSRRKQPLQSADAFLREAGLWGRANRPTDVVAALIRAADEQQRANVIPAEADSRYRAARALLGLGRPGEASEQLDRLEALPADKCPQSLAPLAPLLRQEIDRRTFAR